MQWVQTNNIATAHITADLLILNLSIFVHASGYIKSMIKLMLSNCFIWRINFISVANPPRRYGHQRDYLVDRYVLEVVISPGKATDIYEDCKHKVSMSISFIQVALWTDNLFAHRWLYLLLYNLFWINIRFQESTDRVVILISRAHFDKDIFLNVGNLMMKDNKWLGVEWTVVQVFL